MGNLGYKTLCRIKMFCVVIHKTYYKNSDLSRAFSQYIMVCEVDMITQYLQKILGNHVEFKVCLVSKPVVHVVFSNFCKLREVSPYANCFKNV